MEDGSKKLDFYAELSRVQHKMKASKSKFNSFGKYAYRNCESIFEAFKATKSALVLTISDDMTIVGDRIYVKAIATITDGMNSVSNSAFAREADSKKGMDAAQVTGSTSSYARKYALGGLLLIDDNQDPDEPEPDKDVDAIQEAADSGNAEWIKANWAGVITQKWGKLSPALQNKLQGR